jgi:integrase
VQATLEWADFDPAEGWALVRDLKNESRRKVPVRGPALEALHEWGKVRGLGEARVFAGAGLPRKAWNQALAKAEVKDFRFHDLRHTAASYIVQSGGGIADVC